MIVGLHDSDATRFPNFALMRLSAYHKARGDTVAWWTPLQPFDRVYSSKVFSFTPNNPYLPPDTIKGGTGYGLYNELPVEIDSQFPDYSLYPTCKHAIGYLTRGCIRNCEWCVVPQKEGNIRPYARWEDIKRPDSRDIVLMDNNVLACDWGIEQIERMAGADVRVDINQGLDARLIGRPTARKLGALKWIRFVRMSCDTSAMLPVIEQAVAYLVEAGIKPWRLWCYMLVRDVEEEQRAMALDNLGVEPFAQPFRDFRGGTEPTREMRAFARWVNNKAVFRTTSWHDYIWR